MNPSRRLLAISAVALAIALAAGPVAADWNAGVDLFNQGRFDEAAEHFQAAVKSNPEWPGGYLMLGRCQVALEQNDDALANLRVAVNLGPGDPAGAADLGRLLMSMDRHREARELLEGLDLEPLSRAWQAEVSRMVARCLLAEGRAADAVVLLKTRLEDDPDNAALHREIAVAYQAMGRRDAILEHLTRVYALDPEDHASCRAAIKTALALASASGDEDLKAGYQRRAVELATTLADAAPEYKNVVLAGKAACEVEDLEAAVSWFAAAVHARPQKAAARFYLGRTLASLGRTDEAIEHFRTALGAAPDAELAARIHGQLGRLFACRLELAESARHYRASGDPRRAGQIDDIAGGFGEALEQLAELRSDVSGLTEMQGELEALADADGVAAVAERREAIGMEIASIENNLSEVRVALCN